MKDGSSQWERYYSGRWGILKAREENISFIFMNNLVRKKNFLQNLPYCQWLLLVTFANFPNIKSSQISIS